MKKGCKKVCSFIINDRLYTIYNVTKIEGKSTYVGQTDYDLRRIYIEENSRNEEIITLKHELIHVWLFEKGYKYQNEKMCFGVEDVCEIAAYSNDFVNKITEKYIQKDR